MVGVKRHSALSSPPEQEPRTRRGVVPHDARVHKHRLRLLEIGEIEHERDTAYAEPGPLPNAAQVRCCCDHDRTQDPRSRTRVEPSTSSLACECRIDEKSVSRSDLVEIPGHRCGSGSLLILKLRRISGFEKSAGLSRRSGPAIASGRALMENPESACSRPAPEITPIFRLRRTPHLVPAGVGAPVCSSLAQLGHQARTRRCSPWRCRSLRPWPRPEVSYYRTLPTSAPPSSRAHPSVSPMPRITRAEIGTRETEESIYSISEQCGKLDFCTNW
jgi:hypothetical protein